MKVSLELDNKAINTIRFLAANAKQTHINNLLSVVAGISQGWERWVGDQGECISVERFRASAPYLVILEHFGLTVDEVIYEHAR